MGDSIPSYIRKFKPTLEPDLNFGNKGALATNELRVLGLTAYKKRILAAVSWGRFLAIDSDGRFLGVTRPLPGGMDVKIRDIDFIPETQTVVGADRDGVFIFAGGTLDDLSRYTVRPLIPVKGVPKAGSAVYFGALTNEIFYTDGSNGGMSIVSISGAPAGSIRNDFSTRGPLQAADTVMSWDGNYLYVSDLRAPQILRYRKAGAVVPPAVASPAIAPPAGMTPAPPDSGLPIPGPTTSNWLDSLDAGFAAAAGGGRKVVVLFGAPMAEKSREIELGVLNEQFRRLFPDAAWVKVDVSAMPDAMTRYNFYKVPVVIIFSGDRKELKRFEGGFAQQEFTSADPPGRNPSTLTKAYVGRQQDSQGSTG
jgi:hypothetical protein